MAKEAIRAAAARADPHTAAEQLPRPPIGLDVPGSPTDPRRSPVRTGGTVGKPPHSGGRGRRSLHVSRFRSEIRSDKPVSLDLSMKAFSGSNPIFGRHRREDGKPNRRGITMVLTQVVSNPRGRGRVVTGENLKRSKVNTTTEGGKANLTRRTFVSGTSDASLIVPSWTTEISTAGDLFRVSPLNGNGSGL